MTYTVSSGTINSTIYTIPYHTSRPPKNIVNFHRQFLSCGHRQTHNVKTVQPLQQRKSIGLSVCSRQHGSHSISTELWKCIQCMRYSGCSAVRKYVACAKLLWSSNLITTTWKLRCNWTTNATTEKKWHNWSEIYRYAYSEKSEGVRYEWDLTRHYGQYVIMSGLGNILKQTDVN